MSGKLGSLGLSSRIGGEQGKMEWLKLLPCKTALNHTKNRRVAEKRVTETRTHGTVHTQSTCGVCVCTTRVKMCPSIFKHMPRSFMFGT